MGSAVKVDPRVLNAGAMYDQDMCVITGDSDPGLWTGGKSMPIVTISREVLAILMVALTLSFFGNAVSPKGIALVGDWDPRRGVVSAKAKDDVIYHDLEIRDLETAKALFDKGGLLFVDARPESDYRSGHIQGAMSFPVHRFDQIIGDFWASHPLDTELVIYCSGRLCNDSHHLARLLRDAGYERIRVYIDGFEAWENAQFPIE